MRIGYSLLILCSLMCHVSFSQVEFGVKAGANLATVSVTELPDNSFNPEMKAAYHFGFFANSQVNEKISLTTDLLYSNKGLNNYKANFKFHYINVPILINYAISDNLKIGLGPEVGILMSAYFKLNDDNFDVSTFYNNKIDVGLDVGVEYSINEIFTAGVRYNYGLSNVLGDSQFTDIVTGNPYDSKIRNRVIQIYIGKLFKLLSAYRFF